MKSFKQYLEEVSLSQYRQYYKIVGKHYQEVYDKWFGEGVMRITLPLLGEKFDPVYDEVNRVLSGKGYEISSWDDGIAAKKEGKGIIRIGKLLKDTPDTLKKFNERTGGKVVSKNDGNYKVIISRHLYDILGQSEDRSWTSCKNLKDGENKHYIMGEFNNGGLIAYVVKDDNSKIYKYEYIINPKYSHITILKSKLIDWKESSYSINKKSFVEYFKSYIDEVLKDFPNDKTFQFLSTLLDSNDDILIKTKIGNSFTSHPNINHPLSRLLIVPYFNVNDPSETFLYVPDRPYGKSITGFRETVQKWLDEKQGKKSGLYCLSKSIYDDKYPKTINKDTGEESESDNAEIINFRLRGASSLSSIVWYNNGEAQNYSPHILERKFVLKDEKKYAYPLSTFMEDVFIDEQNFREAYIQGGDAMKNLFISTLEYLIESYVEDSDYMNYYKILLDKVKKDRLIPEMRLG